MSTTAEQFAFPWDIPQGERKRVKTKWEELKEYAALSDDSERSGGLVPLNIAPVLLDVSKQRVAELADQGRLKVHVFFDKKFITINSLAEWINSERRVGRPAGNLPTTFAETYRRVKASRK